MSVQSTTWYRPDASLDEHYAISAKVAESATVTAAIELCETVLLEAHQLQWLLARCSAVNELTILKLTMDAQKLTTEIVYTQSWLEGLRQTLCPMTSLALVEQLERGGSIINALKMCQEAVQQVTNSMSDNMRCTFQNLSAAAAALQSAVRSTLRTSVERAAQFVHTEVDDPSLRDELIEASAALLFDLAGTAQGGGVMLPYVPALKAVPSSHADNVKTGISGKPSAGFLPEFQAGPQDMDYVIARVRGLAVGPNLAAPQDEEHTTVCSSQFSTMTSADSIEEASGTQSPVKHPSAPAQQDSQQSDRLGAALAQQPASPFQAFALEEPKSEVLQSVSSGTSDNAVHTVIPTEHHEEGALGTQRGPAAVMLPNSHYILPQAQYNVFFGTGCLIDYSELEFQYHPDGSLADELGSGITGTVYRAVRGGVQRVAVKALLGKKSERQRMRFAKEMELLQSCRDRHIVQFYGAVLDDQRMMMVMELMEGGTLFDAIADDAKREFGWYRRGRSLALDIARGLAYLHGRQPAVMHMDIKSPNILLTRDKRPKIADVGFSQTVKASSSSSPVTMRGTFAWSAPELLLGEHCTPAVDIFSFGVVLWEIVTGLQPVRGAMQPASPDSAPEAVRDLIIRCRNPHPYERPTAKQVLSTLEQAIFADVQVQRAQSAPRQLPKHVAFTSNRSAYASNVTELNTMPGHTGGIRLLQGSEINRTADAALQHDAQHVPQTVSTSAASHRGSSFPDKDCGRGTMTTEDKGTPSTTGFQLRGGARATKSVTSLPALFVEPPEL